MKKIIVLELNEVIFEYINKYILQGHLPNFRFAIEKFGYRNTTSECNFHELEPWIQWVSVHTGKTFAEHKIFRLGDIHSSDIEQIWESLEKNGLNVCAISPMNAANRINEGNGSIFMPDPWTVTPVTGSRLLKATYKAIRQGVNQNAQGKLSIDSIFTLLLALVIYGRFRSLVTYFSSIANILLGRGWAKAIFLDRFLADVFLNFQRPNKPDFSSLFLNAAAHIQHHYLYNSAAYDGEYRNPKWYMDPSIDPLLHIYKVYDDILGELLNQKDSRLMIVTALQQEPHGKPTFFYRFNNHEVFFRSAGVKFS